MNNENINIRTIIENNEPNRIALSGRIPRIIAYLTRHGVKVQPKVLYRTVGEYREEEGINRVNWVRMIPICLHGIGEHAAAAYLANSLQPKPVGRKIYTVGKFLELAWFKMGELSAQAVSDPHGERFNLFRFEFKTLMDAEIA